MLVYSLTGMLSAMAGVLMVLRLGASQVNIGEDSGYAFYYSRCSWRNCNGRWKRRHGRYNRRWPSDVSYFIQYQSYGNFILLE